MKRNTKQLKIILKYFDFVNIIKIKYQQIIRKLQIEETGFCL